MKTTFKHWIIPAAFILSPELQARSFELPVGCEYGRVTSYDISSEEVAAAVESGYDIYNDEEASNEEMDLWANFLNALKDLVDSFDYLRVETPKHVLQGKDFRAKGNLFDRYANVQFNNSEKGYVGTDKSNLDANAYHNMSFDRTHGYGVVWVNRAGGMCSAEGVWVQKEPEIEVVSLEYGKAVVKFNVDPYSKAAKDANTKVSIEVYGFAEEGSEIEHYPVKYNARTGTTTLHFTSDYYGTNFRVKARIKDGTFEKSFVLGTVSGGSGAHRPCPTCQTDV